jgi:DNA-binding CsgD family transcriptional regulator
MARMDVDALAPIATRLLAPRGGRLSPAEQVELFRIAQNYACKESAAVSGVSYETIRARRKRIYRKLGMGGSGELISSLLGISLRMLADESSTPADARRAGAVS